MSSHQWAKLIRSKLIKFFVLYFLSIVSVVAVQDELSAEATPLSKKGNRVVEYLLKDWRKQFRSTDIATAMTNLGMKQDDKLRLSIAQHLRNNRGLANNLRFWGANNYILSNDEKRITKYLIHMIERVGRYPSFDETARSLDLSQKYLSRRLEFMEAVGIVNRSKNILKYSLTKNYNTWGGPLRYNYHTLYVEGEKPFGVW